MGDKTYINGGAKEIQGQYGPFYNISFRLEDLQQHVNEKGYVNLVMNKRKSPDKYNNTHSFVLNDWKPKPKPEQGTKQEDISVEDLPF